MVYKSRTKIRHLYWCFIGSGHKNCIKEMYERIEYCIQCGEEDVSDILEHIRGVRHECNMSPCSIFSWTAASCKPDT